MTKPRKISEPVKRYLITYSVTIPTMAMSEEHAIQKLTHAGKIPYGAEVKRLER